MSDTTTATIARLSTRDAAFHQRLDALLDWEGVSDKAVQARVEEILADVKQRGDQAVIEAVELGLTSSSRTPAELTVRCRPVLNSWRRTRDEPPGGACAG